MKKTSYEWIEIYGVKVLDPDGWDRKNLDKSMNELITRNEFMQRLGVSTIQFLITKE